MNTMDMSHPEGQGLHFPGRRRALSLLLHMQPKNTPTALAWITGGTQLSVESVSGALKHKLGCCLMHERALP